MKTISQKCQPYYCSSAALLPVGIFHADTRGDYVAVNDRWREIAGITAAEAQGDIWIQALHPDDKERVITEWYQAVKANLPFQAEYRFQNRDGKITWVLNQAVTQKNKAGTVTGYIGTITDITDRKWTEETLSQYCHHLENLVQERTTNLQQVNEELQQELAERKRIEKALRQAEEKLALRDRELLTLHRISEIQLSTQSLNATFDEIVEEISTATNFPIVAIELYDEPRQMMVFAAMKGVPLPPNGSVLEVPADQTLSGTVVRTGEPAIKIYAPSESKKCDSNETLKYLGIKTFICMPMLVHGQAIGTLSLAHPEVMPVDDRLSQWIASLANYIASVTEHKRAEAELRQANDRFQLAAAAVNSLIYDWDVEKNHVHRTEAIINLLGYRPEEAEPRIEWWLDRVHPDDQTRLQSLITAALAQEDTYAAEYRIRNKDNQYVYVWDHALIVRDTSGRAVRVVGSRMDITDAYRQAMQRKQAEEAVKQQKELLQIIFDHIPVMIGFVSATNQFHMVNREWERILGWSMEEMQHENVLPELYPDPEYRQFILDYIKAATGKWHDFKTRVRDGRILDTCWANVRLSDGSTIGIGQDITERKQMEEALRQQFLKEQLEATVIQRIHKSLNLEEILNTTVVEARKFLACDRVLIYRFHSDGSGVVVVESVGAGWKPISGTIIRDCCFAETYTQLYQQGRVRAVEDIYGEGLTSCYVDLLAQFQVKANLVAPIVQDEKLWGLLVAHQCSGTRQWLSLEIELLKSLATQAAIAIQKSELYQQAQAEITQRQQAEAALRQQFSREQLVGAIAQRIRRSLNLEEILNTTVTEVRQFLECDRVIIFRFGPDWSGIVEVESVDKDCSAILGTNIHDPCFEVSHVKPYKEGRVKAIPDIYTAQLSQCHIDLLAQFQVRANLVVPILEGEDLWGLLIAHHCRAPRQWQQFEMDLLKQLATQVAIAIQQSELYKQTQHQVQREQALNRVIQTIRNSLDLTTIFSTAVREIAQLLQADRADIVQYLPERKVWLNVADYHQNSDLPNALGQEVSDEGNELAARLKRLEIVRIDDSKTCSDSINRDIAQNYPGAWLLVPLHFGFSVWGSLSLVRNRQPYLWQDSEVELACAVADQVAIALQQAELYQQSRSATAQALTKSEQLEQTLSELQKTQTQLVQSEKMSSLGQLVAGVAHEINNPVTFIYANLAHAESYTQDILGLLKLYQQRYPNPTPDIDSEIEAIDLDFLIEDLPRLLNSMKVGAERICEIVGALRNFSRLAEAEIKPVDIHEGLNSTLTILQNRLKAQGNHPEIQVVKEYGNLPRVECYAGQLNQVFMNLLSNAIDAIDEHNQTRTPEQIKANPCFIRIRTEVLDDCQIAIRIIDNGPGMTEQVKSRIFDPFFTTKPVGAGTGLGLSISYQIVVEKHRGQLQCFSQLGQGTEFVIQIPLLQRSIE